MPTTITVQFDGPMILHAILVVLLYLIFKVGLDDLPKIRTNKMILFADERATRMDLSR